MTLFVPDISHHQAGISIQALKDEGAAALIARVGQGAGRRTNGQTYGTTQDREWARHRDEARRIGLPLVAYWYTGNLLTPEQNASYAKQWVGDTAIPWMLDHEDASGDGVTYCRTVEAFRAAGLRVILGYVPNWYWSGAMARSDLRCGPPIVNSRYSTRQGTPAAIYGAAGADTGAGWTNYGGQTTLLWQFTNQAQMAGRPIDCSAYKGSLASLLELISGTPIKEGAVYRLARRPDNTNDPRVWAYDGVTRVHVEDQTELAGRQWQMVNYLKVPNDVQVVEDIRVCGADIAGLLAGLGDDEAKVIDAVREIVAADADAELQISDAQVQQLADAVVSAVPPQVAEAVRQAFARAGGTPVTVTMPNLVGLTVTQAREALTGWTGNLTQVPGYTSDPAQLGLILEQQPVAGAPTLPTGEVWVRVATQVGTGD